MKIQSSILYRIFTKLARIFKPDENVKRYSNLSPHLSFANKDEIALKNIKKYSSLNKGKKMTFLDVGGRAGEFRHIASDYEYFILELDKNEEDIPGINFIQGDICSCSEIDDESFDIVFSNNVFEHLEKPWDAAMECVRIVKKSGLVIHSAPFACRYHPVPIDYFRYTAQGLESLFLLTNKIETIHSGYDITNRREDHRGGKIPGGLDTPPIDELGGWRENWQVLFVGRKIN